MSILHRHRRVIARTAPPVVPPVDPGAEAIAASMEAYPDEPWDYLLTDDGTLRQGFMLNEYGVPVPE